MDALNEEGIRGKFEATSERICENIVGGADVEELWTTIEKRIEDTANEVVEKNKRVLRVHIKWYIHLIQFLQYFGITLPQYLNPHGIRNPY